METLTFDQVHLGVPDPAAAARWYQQYLDAAPGEHIDRVMVGGIRVIFLQNDAPAPSGGAAIDRFGLSFADLDARLRALDGSGARVVAPPAMLEGCYRSAVVEDPWGARVELVEDPDTIGFHHVCLRVPDPDLVRGWYVERLGGSPGSLKGRLEGLQYGSVWVFMEPGAAEPSRGHAIDHVGWRMQDLRSRAADLKTRGLRFTTEPQPGPPGAYSPTLMSFAEDPWGVKIELLQRREDAAV